MRPLFLYALWSAFTVRAGPVGVTDPYAVAETPHENLVVGPRNLGPFLYGKGCTSTQFASAIDRTRVSETGSARNPPGDASPNPANFEFSFEFPTDCPPPKVFSSAEACDLLNGFGGIFMRGDSFVRHVNYALHVILTGLPDGAAVEGSDICRGDKMYNDKESCRWGGRSDSQSVGVAKVCSGSTYLKFEELPCTVEPSNYVPSYLAWHDHLPLNKTALSTVVIQSYGIHCHWQTQIPYFGIFKPLFQYAKITFPRPVMLWFGIHAPASNKPVKYLATEGAGPVKAYNNVIFDMLQKLLPGSGIQGAMGILNWYGMTQGALSFDGSHYMYQINMEKAHLLLNYLDILWGEIAHAGGFWDLPQLCPGPLSYQCNFMKDPEPPVPFSWTG